MKCPKCKKEIANVNVISYCWHKGILEGNKIVDYDFQEVLDTVKIECSKCYEDIRNLIEE